MPTASYLRLVCTRAGSVVGIREIEARATVGGADQCSGGTASSSGDYSPGNAAAYAFDDATYTLWASDSGTAGTTAWIQYAFASSVTIAEIEVSSYLTGYAASQIEIQISDNGTDWTTTDTYSGLSWSSDEVKTFAVSEVGGGDGGGSVTIGKWTGGSASQAVPATYAAPTLLFGTEARNDGSVYGFSASTATLTLPASDLADGYLIRVSVETENTINNRANVRGKVVQASGTGTFVGPVASSYSRDTTEDRTYTTCWAFVDGPSASSTYQFQMAYDGNEPGGGVTRAVFEVIPLWYADFAVYTSTSTAALAGTTPTKLTGFSGTDGANIALASDVVTLSADNATYLILGGNYLEGVADERTQRWTGLRVNGTFEHAAKAYSYLRYAAYGHGWGLTWMHQTATANDTFEMDMYAGEGVSDDQGGAEDDGLTTATAAEHVMVFLQLPAAAETFRAVGSTQEQIGSAGPVDMTASQVSDIDWNDSAAFTRASDDGMNVEVDSDLLVFANIGAASGNVGSTVRLTAEAALTLDGTEDADVFHGNYLRNNQAATGTFGWSANIVGFAEAAADQDIGLSVTHAAGSAGGGGDVVVPAGWIGWGAIRLGSLVPAASTAVTVGVWSGSAWVDAPVKYYDGAAWQDATSVKRWSGTTWEDV